MTSKSRFKTALAALALGLTLGTAQARDEPMWNPERVSLQTQANVTQDNLRAAIIRGGTRRNWTVLKEAAGEVQLKQSRNGKHEATVKVSYDATGYQLSYADSFNLNYDAGRQRIHPTYNFWLRNLSADLASEVSLLGLNK
ncbi:hypothetical protein J7U46_20710 [Pelomonas sp. V22]|uniref:hypothetical protein n=1 Tax=Pelomonas sp. V22 TaxID=2822139 RepID=UPI0024A9F2C5|nr:hypothetical protein [Pelomonas sp. V22]MDI4635498.1 hypothetical protein [Pelomonas sp. V22]